MVIFYIILYNVFTFLEYYLVDAFILPPPLVLYLQLIDQLKSFFTSNENEIL